MAWDYQHALHALGSLVFESHPECNFLSSNLTQKTCIVPGLCRTSPLLPALLPTPPTLSAFLSHGCDAVLVGQLQVFLTFSFTFFLTHLHSVPFFLSILSAKDATGSSPISAYAELFVYTTLLLIENDAPLSGPHVSFQGHSFSLFLLSQFFFAWVHLLLVGLYAPDPAPLRNPLPMYKPPPIHPLLIWVL